MALLTSLKLAQLPSAFTQDNLAVVLIRKKSAAQHLFVERWPLLHTMSQIPHAARPEDKVFGLLGLHGLLVPLPAAFVDWQQGTGLVARLNLGVPVREYFSQNEEEYFYSGNTTQTQLCGAPACNSTTPCCSGTYEAVGYDGATFCQAQPVRLKKTLVSYSARNLYWNLDCLDEFHRSFL